MIRAAIVGMGVWGQNLVRHVQGRSSLIRFTAGATRTPDKARAFAAQHGIQMFDSYDAVLAAADVDAVVLATPHTQHTDQIIAAARAGKHVFSEKPMGLDRSDAQRAAQAC
ncbi:MAG: Gfo/Idh/MocA family protein, partial [Betaproteobacteria bacterium]